MYIYCILSKDVTLSFVKFCNKLDLDNGNEVEYFQRAMTWDDIKIVLPIKYLFEFIDRVQLNRLQDIKIEHIERSIGLLDNFCSEIEYFDKDFILSTIKDSFHPYKENNMDLSDSIPKLISFKYQFEKYVIA